MFCVTNQKLIASVRTKVNCFWLHLFTSNWVIVRPRGFLAVRSWFVTIAVIFVVSLAPPPFTPKQSVPAGNVSFLCFCSGVVDFSLFLEGRCFPMFSANVRVHQAVNTKGA